MKSNLKFISETIFTTHVNAHSRHFNKMPNNDKIATRISDVNGSVVVAVVAHFRVVFFVWEMGLNQKANKIKKK